MSTQFEDVTTGEEFRERLSELLSAAVENGVSIEGGWTCETNPGGEEWDVVVASLDSERDTE